MILQILYKYCYLGHTSIYLVHVLGCVDDASIKKSANPFLGAIAILLFSTRPCGKILHIVNRLDTDLTTKLARCLRRRDDNRPTLSMTGTHAITNRRHKTLSMKRYFQFLPLLEISCFSNSPF